jgi:hypothetical protein
MACLRPALRSLQTLWCLAARRSSAGEALFTGVVAAVFPRAGFAVAMLTLLQLHYS